MPRLVYDQDKKEIDFRKMIATDLRDFPRLWLLSTRPQKGETGIILKKTCGILNTEFS